MPDFSAQESGLGYLYQARYALWLLLDGPEERDLVLETLDDIVLGRDGAPRDLLQTKHNTVPARLTDSSPQLWKTLRVWSTHVKAGLIRLPPTTLTLITTAEAPADSIAAALRPGRERDSTGAANRLAEVARISKNEDLQTSTSDCAGSCAGIHVLQHRQMARRILSLPPVGNQMLFFPPGEWMGASVPAAVRTIFVCRSVSRIGLRISTVYHF